MGEWTSARFSIATVSALPLFSISNSQTSSRVLGAEKASTNNSKGCRLISVETKSRSRCTATFKYTASMASVFVPRSTESTTTNLVSPDNCTNPTVLKILIALFSHSMWLHRPLRDTQLQYAAGDIQLIAKLYSAFTQKDFIDEPKLLQQSARYIALRKDSLRAAGEGHPLLPLEILSAPSISSAKHVCLTCKRSLDTSAFSNARKNCWVCRAVSVRPKEWDDDDDYGYEDDDNEFLILSDNDSYGCGYYNDLSYDEDDYF